jgi:hypothetical protein
MFRLMRSAFEAVQEPGEAEGRPRTDLDSRTPRGSLQSGPSFLRVSPRVIIVTRLYSTYSRPTR